MSSKIDKLKKGRRIAYLKRCVLAQQLLEQYETAESVRVRVFENHIKPVLSGRIEIVGSIAEWNSNNATDLRQRCNELKASGVTDCNVYLMTTGGDCLQANEIVNRRLPKE